MDRIIDLRAKKLEPPSPLEETSSVIEEAHGEEPDEEPLLPETPDEESLSWEAPEYYHYEKSSEWFWALFVIAAGIVIAGILLKNILLAIFTLIAGFTIALFGARRPHTINVTVSNSGIIINNKQYPYETLESFWIFYQPPEVKEISIKSSKTLMPHIKIPLGDADPEEIRVLLARFLPEKMQEESLIDAIARRLGF